MFFQKGVFLLLLTRSALSFTATPQLSSALYSNNAAFCTQPSTFFALNRAKSLNRLFSEVSDEAIGEETAVEEETTEAAEDEADEATEDEVDEVVSSEEFKIYVGNLSFDYGQDEIEALFTPHGEVQDCFVPTDKFTGKPRGFAFVTMASKVAGEAAIDALHQTDVGGRTIRVNEQLSKEDLEKRKKPRQANGTKIYVGNLPFDTEEDELISMFTQYGKVNECFLPLDRETGRPRGFGFITMAEEEALSAIDALDGSDFGGRGIIVNKSLPKGESTPRARRIKLYVGNLAFSTEEDEVLSLFSEYGDVIDCYMPRDRETDRPRGFAFVTMGEEDALAAEADCDGFEMDGRVLRVNQAQPKGSGGGNGGGYQDNSVQESGFYDNGSGSTWEDGY